MLFQEHETSLQADKCRCVCLIVSTRPIAQAGALEEAYYQCFVPFGACVCITKRRYKYFLPISFYLEEPCVINLRASSIWKSSCLFPEFDILFANFETSNMDSIAIGHDLKLTVAFFSVIVAMTTAFSNWKALRCVRYQDSVLARHTDDFPASQA